MIDERRCGLDGGNHGSAVNI